MRANALGFSRQNPWGSQEQQSSIRILGDEIFLEQYIGLHCNHDLPSESLAQP